MPHLVCRQLQADGEPCWATTRTLFTFLRIGGRGFWQRVGRYCLECGSFVPTEDVQFPPASARRVERTADPIACRQSQVDSEPCPGKTRTLFALRKDAGRAYWERIGRHCSECGSFVPTPDHQAA